MTSSKSRNSDPSGTIGKALTVLRSFIDRQEEWGVRELALALGQPGSSVHRLLKILLREGLLEWDPASQKYRTGMELTRWSAVLGRRNRLVDLGRPHLADLAAQTGEGAWLALHDAANGAIVQIADVPAARPPAYASPVGRVEPLWSTACGRAVLAFLDDGDRARLLGLAAADGIDAAALAGELADIRINGYAVGQSRDAGRPTLVAAPVLDAKGRPLASVTLTVPRNRFLMHSEDELGAALVDCGRRISKAMGSQLLGGGNAGLGHLASSMIAGLLRERVPSIKGWAGGVNTNITDLQTGGGAYGLAVMGSLEAAVEGRKPFKAPHDRLRLVCGLATLYLHIVARADLPVTRFSDLLKYRISAGDRGFTTHAVFTDLMRLAGATPRDVERQGGELIPLNYAEANRGFTSGRLDVVVSLTGIENPPYVEMARSHDIKLVPVERGLADAFLAESPGYTARPIPAGSYRGCDLDALTLVSSSALVTTCDRSEDEVYGVARTLDEHKADLTETAPNYWAISPNTVASPGALPLHPGARRYWVETGQMWG